VLRGGSGNDTLDGGAGVDYLFGNGGDDRITYDAADAIEDGGVGNNTLVLVQAVQTTVNLGASNQVTTPTGPTVTYFENVDGSGSTAGLTLIGDAGVNVLTGGSAGDVIYGSGGADVISGGAGDDSIDYEASAASINGGTGNDCLSMRVAATVNLANANQVSGVTGTFTNFEYVDASAVTTAVSLTGDIKVNVLRGGSWNDVLNGGAGADYLFGNAGDDTITGGLDNDSLYGDIGNDTYRFARGDGSDTIFENDATVGNKDILKFTSGVTDDQLWFKQVGNNLEISVIGTTDKVTVDSWFLGSARHVESIQAAGMELVDSNVINLVTAMASMTPPPAGQTTLTTYQHHQLDTVITANWRLAA
jgi:Ca2+-binding RTX toxin-like protein